MAEQRVFVRVTQERWEWAIFDHKGLLSSHDHSEGPSQDEALKQSLGDDFDGELIWVLSGDEVLLTPANVPSRQYRQIVQAVPYVLEEQLATDVEACSFAMGDRTANGDISVAVIDRALLESRRERAQSLGVRLSAMLSEPSLVPFNGRTEVLIDDDRAHIRWSDAEALTVPFDDLALTLSLLPEADIVITLPTNEIDRVERVVSELQAAECHVETSGIEEAPFVYLACGFGDQVNLLQGDYKIEKRRSGKPRIWRSVAVLFAFGLILHLGLAFGQGWYLSKKAEDYRSESLALYEDVFPADRNVRDVRRRWNNHLGKSSSSGGDFILAFSQSARGLQAAGLSLSNVNFNESRGDLIIQVTGSRSEALVEYAQRLNANGVNAQIGTINQEGDAIRGSIKIKVSG